VGSSDGFLKVRWMHGSSFWQGSAKTTRRGTAYKAELSRLLGADSPEPSFSPAYSEGANTKPSRNALRTLLGRVREAARWSRSHLSSGRSAGTGLVSVRPWSSELGYLALHQAGLPGRGEGTGGGGEHHEDDGGEGEDDEEDDGIACARGAATDMYELLTHVDQDGNRLEIVERARQHAAQGRWERFFSDCGVGGEEHWSPAADQVVGFVSRDSDAVETARATEKKMADERAKRAYFDRHKVDLDSAADRRKRYDMLLKRRRAHDKKVRARPGMAERFQQSKKTKKRR